jgi:zinc protease
MNWRLRAFAYVLVGVLLTAGAVASAQTATATKPAPQAVKPAPAPPAMPAAPQAVKPAPAAPAPAQTAPLGAALPVDPNVTVGKFANGVRYIIRVNPKPEKRAELRLVVDAGAVLEDDDQVGLAHFVEHMAFNGTTHFPKGEMVKFLESTGMRFGPSINAGTSHDQTVYMLQIPTDKPEIFAKSFVVLEDWAHNLLFDPAEIDKERGVIIEEWRLHRGAAARMQDKQYPILLQGSRYADRNVIGTVENLETFKHDTLKRFYRDWYRPDLMTVVAVGDFDKAAVETLLRQHFAAIPAVKNPRPRQVFPVPAHAETLYAIATDKEAPGTTVAVYNILPLRDTSTVGAYRQDIVEGLVLGMLNRRLSDLTQKADPPFLRGGIGRGRFVRSAEASMVTAIVKDGGIERGLDAVYTEAERAARFGFVATELDRGKKDLLRGQEQLFTERDKQESASYAGEYVRHVTVAEPIPGIAYEYALHQRFVPEITVDEANRVAKTLLGEGSRVVVVSAPEKPGVMVPDGPALASVMKGVSGKTLQPYVDTVADAVLMETLPAPGSVVKTTKKDPWDITEWELSNGVRVVLKPTTFKQDEILFRATSPGGTSLASDADYVAATTASQVIAAGGIGKFSSIDLRKVLAGKVARVSPTITGLEEGLSGSASPKDLDTMLQLIHLSFTQPRADPTIFGVMTAQMRAVIANQAASPAFAFTEALQSALYQNHFRARPMSPALIDEMSLEKSLAFYKDRFADASDFTFVFVGSFDLATMKPLVERYLGSLPSTGRKETWKDVGMKTATGVLERTVKKGVEPQSQMAMVFSGPFRWNREQRVAIRVMSSVLETRLRETLREELSGTYGVTVSANYTEIPYEQFQLNIAFGCNPARVEELRKAVFKEIEAFKASGPTEKQVSDIREQSIREFETNMKQNAYLLGQIWLRYQVPHDLGEFFTLDAFYKTIDAAMIQQAARTYLAGTNLVQVTLLPEKMPEEAPKK